MTEHQDALRLAIRDTLAMAGDPVAAVGLSNMVIATIGAHLGTERWRVVPENEHGHPVGTLEQPAPGPHRHHVEQHRDGKAPWCNVCGRDEHGTHHDYMPSIVGRAKPLAADDALRENEVRCSTCGTPIRPFDQPDGRGRVWLDRDGWVYINTHNHRPASTR
jgi:hypothetical protein